MPELSKALLLEIGNDNQPTANGRRVAVQFNPSSLRLQYSNQSEGGRQAGRQARQFTGNGATTLNVDLVFDSADEGQTGAPQPVLERTKEIEFFITPHAVRGQNQAPPRLSFRWGTLRVDGVMETLSIDLDHFAHDGTALRAKASLSIKGQDPEHQFNRRGAGANSAVGATPAAASAATPAQPGALGLLGGLQAGGIGAAIAGALGPLAQSTRALGGESLAQLAQRNGIAPAAWRALSSGVGNPASLPAGREVNLPAAAQASPPVGASQGAQSGSAATAAQRVGLQPAATGAASAQAGLQRGYALAGAGGLGAALQTVKADAGVDGATWARGAFAGAGGAGGASVDAFSAAAATPGRRNQVFSLRADPRADAFGRGVPLRDRVQIAHDERANLLSGQAVIKRSSDGLPPTTADPAVPGWVALPLAPQNSSTALHARGCRCGCGS